MADINTLKRSGIADICPALSAYANLTLDELPDLPTELKDKTAQRLNLSVIEKTARFVAIEKQLRSVVDEESGPKKVVLKADVDVPLWGLPIGQYLLWVKVGNVEMMQCFEVDGKPIELWASLVGGFDYRTRFSPFSSPRQEKTDHTRFLVGVRGHCESWRCRGIVRYGGELGYDLVHYERDGLPSWDWWDDLPELGPGSPTVTRSVWNRHGLVIGASVGTEFYWNRCRMNVRGKRYGGGKKPGERGYRMRSRCGARWTNRNSVFVDLHVFGNFGFIRDNQLTVVEEQGQVIFDPDFDGATNIGLRFWVHPEVSVSAMGFFSLSDIVALQQLHRYPASASQITNDFQLRWGLGVEIAYAVEGL